MAKPNRRLPGEAAIDAIEQTIHDGPVDPAAVTTFPDPESGDDEPDDDEAPDVDGTPSTTDGPADRSFDLVHIRMDQIERHPMNPQEETAQTFQTLVNNIDEVGFHQNCVVVPIGPDRYRMIIGEHRWLAAKLLHQQDPSKYPGTVPCVVRNWDELTQIAQLIRDNVTRGRRNPKKMQAVVNALRSDHQIDAALASRVLGYDNDRALYRELPNFEADAQAAVAQETQASAAPAAAEVTTEQHLTLLVKALIARHGSTLLHGYLAFPYGGQLNYLVEIDAALKDQLDALARIAIDRKVDISTLLASMLRDGLQTYRT